VFSLSRSLLIVFVPACVLAQELPLRDPMQPQQTIATPGARGSAPRRFELTAVLVSRDRKVAVVNGRVYREGDVVDGAEITRIEPQAVHLRRGSEDTVVRLRNERTDLQITRGDSTP